MPTQSIFIEGAEGHRRRALKAKPIAEAGRGVSALQIETKINLSPQFRP
jgi:hypothetical protein